MSKKPAGAPKTKEDEELDEELEESFPASDPPSITQPEHREPARKKKR